MQEMSPRRHDKPLGRLSERCQTLWKCQTPVRLLLFYEYNARDVSFVDMTTSGWNKVSDTLEVSDTYTNYQLR